MSMFDPPCGMLCVDAANYGRPLTKNRSAATNMALRLMRPLVVLALMILASFVMRLAWLGWHHALCRAPAISDPAFKDMRLPAGPCWEYWFYRYQTLVSTFVALGAAVLAWRGVQSQVSVERARDVRQHLDLLVDIQNRVVGLMSSSHLLRFDNIANQLQPENIFDNDFRLSRFKEQFKEVRSLSEARVSVLQAVQRLAINDPVSAPAAALNRAFRSSCSEVAMAYADVIAVLGHSNIDSRKRELALSAAKLHEKNLVKSMEKVEEADAALDTIMQREIDRSTKQLDRLTHWMRADD